MQTYECADCHSPVECKEIDGNVVFIRTCGHTEAAVLANMQAVVYGESATK